MPRKPRLKNLNPKVKFWISSGLFQSNLVNSEEETEVVPTQTHEVEEQVEDQKEGENETKKEPEIKRVYTKEEADEIGRVNIVFCEKSRNIYFRISNLFNFLIELQELSNVFWVNQLETILLITQENQVSFRDTVSQIHHPEIICFQGEQTHQLQTDAISEKRVFFDQHWSRNRLCTSLDWSSQVCLNLFLGILFEII